MDYVVLVIVFAVLGFIFGALIYFVQYKISKNKNKSQDDNSSSKDD